MMVVFLSNVLFLLGMSLGAVLLTGFFVLVWLLWIAKTDPLRHLPGLDAGFFKPLYGHVVNADAEGQNKWMKKHGRTWRFPGFGRWDYRLVTTDLQSLTYILKSPVYEKPWPTQRLLSSFLGRGISVMEGEEHERQRKIVAPAFSSQNVMRSYAPIFIEKAAELCDTWQTAIAGSQKPVEIEVTHWLARATLDVVGLASFDHNFEAIKHENNGVYLAYKRIFEQVNRGLTLRNVAEIFLPRLERLWPSEMFKAIQKNIPVIHEFGKEVVENRHRLASLDTFSNSNSRQSGKDLLSRLIDANTLATDPSQRLTDQELLDQINTFLFVGSDSTGIAIAWCLHFLSLHPDIQTKLREKLLALPPMSDAETRAQKIDGLDYLDNVVKETLRLCPPVYSTIRTPTRDDDIPLSEPLVLRDGRTTSTVKIRKGSMIHIPLEGFNVSIDIWGPSATKFEPNRWLDLPHSAKSHPGLAGLMTFSFGGHACPGWKFAMMEMKTFVASLVSQFVFSPAKEIRRNYIILQRPYVKNEVQRGHRLPLNVQPYSA